MKRSRVTRFLTLCLAMLGLFGALFGSLGCSKSKEVDEQDQARPDLASDPANKAMMMKKGAQDGGS